MILVVIADPQLRQLVGWVLDELDLRYIALPTCRRAVAELQGRPALAIVDLDDVSTRLHGLAAVLGSGWGEAVPLIGLSRRPDSVTEIGAVEVLGKPVNVGLLISALSRLAKSP